MSLHLRVRPSMGVVLLMSSFWHLGCGGEAAHPDASPQPDAPVATAPEAAVSLALDLSSIFQREVPADTAEIAAEHVIRGTMTATPSTGGQSLVVDWTVVLDDATWSVESSKSLVLTPGSHQFTLVLDDGIHRYVGQTLATVQAGENRISMTIRPVLGELAIQPDVTELPVFRLQYPADQIASLSNPRIGVIINDGPEQIVGLNPATGLSDMYISLSDGPHRIQLRLYDGSLQRGRSVPAQEAVIVRRGEHLVMDIEPLHGEAVFDLIEQGNQLAIRIRVPGVVVEEVGGLASLSGRFSFTCPGSAPVERALELVPLAGGDYQAVVVLDEAQYGMCAYTLTFLDRAVTPAEQVASCSATVEIGREDQSAECELLLRRRALIGGELLSIVGLNVLDAAWLPVAGAVVSDGERVLGITGAGAFGTPGYLKLHVSAGTYRLTALHPATMQFGQATVTVAPLELHNIDIQLVQTTTACSNTAQCPPPSFVPDSDCQGFEDVCDLSGTQTGETTTHTCITGGCIFETVATVQACVRDTSGVSCDDTDFGDWGDCGTFADTCDESGTRTRSRTDYVCSAGACAAVLGADTEACTRDTDGTTCGAPTFGAWSACAFESDVCDETGTQTRTVTTYACAGASCTAVTSTETQACTRDTDNTTCGETTFGNWSACTFEGGVCDTTGTRTRTATDRVCAGAACTAVTRTEIDTTCSRAPGDCGAPSFGSWGPCQNFGSACNPDGRRSRTVTDPQCNADTCGSVSWTETESCYIPVDCGGTSVGSWGPCQNAGTACDPEGVRSRTVTESECVDDSCESFSWTQSEGCPLQPLSCGGLSVGSWGPCVNVGTACDPQGIQSRTVTESQCVGNGCVTNSWTETQDCFIPEPNCPPPSVGSWGPCVADGGSCDTTGTQTRTVTFYECMGNGCVPVSWTESQTCPVTPTCGGTSVGPWGSCQNAGTVCEPQGTQTRTVTTNQCIGNSCVGVSETQSQSCPISPPTCPPPSVGSWSECDFGADTCNNTGTRSRTLISYSCVGNGCAPTFEQQTELCWRDSGCSPGWVCCGYDGCVPPGAQCP